MKLYIKIVKNFNCFKKICGLTILDRIILSFYHSGISKINIILSGDNNLDDKIKNYLKKYKLDINFLIDENVLQNSIVICSDTIVNEEYIKSFLNKNTGLYTQVNFKINKKEDEKKAETLLICSCNKIKESFVAKLHRMFSLPISRQLCKTFLTPNQISVLFCFISFIGACFIISGNTFLYYLGILMQPFAMVIDCCDGEVARLKQQYSSIGEWVDTICDNLATLFFISAISIVNYNINTSEFNYYLGYFSVILYLVSIILMFLVQLTLEKGGSFKEINKKFKNDGSRLKIFLAAIMERTSITIVLSILCFFYFTQTALILTLLGSIPLTVILFFRISKLFFKK